jgi:hypothetical protein
VQAAGGVERAGHGPGVDDVPVPVRTGAEVWVNGCSDPR